MAYCVEGAGVDGSLQNCVRLSLRTDWERNHVQLLFKWIPSPLRPSKLLFEYLLLLCTCGGSTQARARGKVLFRRRPGMGPTLQRHPFSGLVDSAAPVLLTKSGLLGALIPCPALSQQAGLLTHLKFENRLRSDCL
ncbi:uncharacterized [Tachysurus ichikawai]